MALAIDSINDLDADLVEQLQDEFAQLVQEKYPEISLIRGVFHDLVCYFAGGISGAMNQTEVQRLLDSSSLLAIEEDPTLADSDIVDRVMSNYLVTRKTGSAAAGEIAIVVSADASVIIASGTTFSASGVVFAVDSAFTARPTTGVVTSDTDQLLEPLGDGTYSFTITATAAVSGASGNIRRGTTMVPSIVPTNYVTSYAGTDFSGGTDTELNADLLKRLQLGVAAKVMQGRTNIKALLKEQSLFKDTLDYSIVGYGNPEMMRDQHGIIPISSGGRIDIYARTATLPQAISMLKTATLVKETADGGVWQFSIGKDDAPGFYEVEQIILTGDAANTGGFEIVADVRGLDLPSDEFVPDLVDSVEGAYTRYQTAVIQFLDTVTETSGLTVGSSTQSYSVAILAMPLIKDLQTFCDGSGVRNLASDLAVKAAVPCFLTVNFDVRKGAETADPNLTSIKTALANAVNTLGFPGQLHASLVADVAHNYLTARQAIGRVDMHGRIRRPNGTEQIIRATDVLTVPDDPGNLVTGNTVAFILEVENIGVSVIAEGYTTEI
jgi:hypothetical protein